MNGRIEDDHKNYMPIVGRIKCGMVNDKGYPQSLDYFRATGNYMAMFTEAFGDKPTSIEIVFLSDTVKDVCDERYEIRKGSKLYAWGDGETFNVWDDKTDYRSFTKANHPDIMERVEKRLGAKWDRTLTLRFLIPRIKGVLGVWQLVTKGEASSIPQIVTIFDKTMTMAGTVKGIPFDLSVEKVKSQKPSSKSSFPVIKIIPNASEKSMEMISKIFGDKKQIEEA